MEQVTDIKTLKQVNNSKAGKTVVGTYDFLISQKGKQVRVVLKVSTVTHESKTYLIVEHTGVHSLVYLVKDTKLLSKKYLDSFVKSEIKNVKLA